MEIGPKLREFRKAKKFSQGDIESKTGLLRCYISRVEKGHTIPNVETLEKFAWALKVPLYRLFTDGQPVNMPKLPSIKAPWGADGRHQHELRLFAKAFRQLNDRKQKLLMGLAQEMVTRRVKKVRYFERRRLRTNNQRRTEGSREIHEGLG
jgi:transcriptional regulator with XRE-family HTH domain